ncbi:hypothetical protein M9980_12450 [Sphingomonas donggukensis]|uniref:Spermidine synthase n=1 Tax=Sphingomonas donggukensis TaxID=2949093 RepID=A0ABY4TSG7_9SPHN|nr:hypothetical protein [Sphingomonas donggukensis]URW75335.1 hypothetical protein M9980_12450 [Sphingomonas donggukensis]
MTDIDPAAGLGPVADGVWLPRYRAGRCRDWTIDLVTLAGTRGYWGETFALADTAVLTGPSQGGRETWMSIVPMEIESQQIGIAASYGHTVVMGLGMGWCAGSVALRERVTQVTVIERDPAVIALIADLALFDQLPAHCRDKITVVEADALEWRPDTPVDSLQADFWAKLLEPQKWDDVRRIQANVRAESLYFWGQELELWRLICRGGGAVPSTLSRDVLDRAVADTGLPIVLGDDRALPEKIVAAARWWAPRDDDWYR